MILGNPLERQMQWRLRFALLPVPLPDGRFVWLQTYWTRKVRRPVGGHFWDEVALEPYEETWPTTAPPLRR